MQNYPPFTLLLGFSVSLSLDASTLAVGDPLDNNATGATWIFILNGSTYQQLGNKLVGNANFESCHGNEKIPCMCTVFMGRATTTIDPCVCF